MIEVIGFHHRRLLPAPHLALIEEARVLVGGRRHLENFPEFRGEKLELKSPLDEVLKRLKELAAEKKVAVLASGDPLFFGLGRRLLSWFPPEELRFHPAPTAFQLAFARAKIPWEKAKILSLHGKRPFRNLHLEIAPFREVAFFTDPENTPDRLASYLLEKGLKGEAIVCENLGLPEERITRCPLEEVPSKEFSPLNVFILLKEASPRRLHFGLPEKFFAHKGGLITKDFIRARIISLLSPFPEATVWDLGAGSGAVGLELASLSFRGEAYLVEKDPSRSKLIYENLKRLKLDNVFVIEKPLEEALAELPSPDLVFLGGGLRSLLENTGAFLAKLKASTRICATFVCLENLLRAREFFEKEGFEVGFEALWGARGKRLPGEVHMLDAENPVFILAAQRGER
ncbi:MAG: precorrin-6y C5,15-methyltransferase (decarboxylating) subunit CbiE [Thermodesulfobacteria bacterium]|nr:precorrin-6y C5,15-methyltransferase (decarboxylating) subunit CbiE [Thermodesulfobacteriota bacterium]